MSKRQKITPYVAIACLSILPILLTVLSSLKDNNPDVNVPFMSPSFVDLLLRHNVQLLALSAATAVLLSVLLILHYTGKSQIPLALAVLVGGLASWTSAWHLLKPQVSELPVMDIFAMLAVVNVSSVLPILIQWTVNVSFPKGIQARLLFILGAMIFGLLLLAAFFASPYGLLLVIFFGIDFTSVALYLIVLAVFVAFPLILAVLWAHSKGNVSIKRMWRDVSRSITGR